MAPPPDFNPDSDLNLPPPPPDSSTMEADPNIVTQNLEEDDGDITKAEGVSQSSFRKSLPKTYSPVLIGLSGPVRGHRFSIQKHLTTVGRGSTCEWRIADGASSRHHFRILYENHIVPDQIPQCWVEDLRSRNGTELNGAKIQTLMALRERDRITVGSSVIGFFIRDDQELRHDQSLYINATQDPLTGLKNRRMLKEYVNHYLSQAMKYSKPLSLVLFDIDFFKKINDTYGHDVGDQALCLVAKVFKNHCRDHDLVARWGGEEFALAMGNVSADAALLLAERMRQEIERLSIDVPGAKSPLKLTISAGGTCFQAGDSYEDIFNRADEALFEAKKTGRNRSVFKPAVVA